MFYVFIKALVLQYLHDNQIHIWYLKTDEFNQETSAIQYLAILADEEKKRRSRFYFKKDQHRYLLTRYFVRCILSIYFPYIAPAEWVFKTNKFGRPEISEASILPDFSFNLSHTQNIIVCAVTKSGTLGIDVEHVLKDRPLQRLSDRFFSYQEANFLNNLNEIERTTYFYKIWTLKEAFIKAEGKGLSIALDSFWFKMRNNTIQFEFNSQLNTRRKKYYFFQTYFANDMIDTCCELALAVHIKSKNIESLITRLFKFSPSGDHQSELLSFNYHNKL